MPVGPVGGRVLPEQDERQAPPDGTAEPQPGSDEQAGVGARGEQRGEQCRGRQLACHRRESARPPSGTAASGATSVIVASTAAAGSCQRATGFSQR